MDLNKSKLFEEAKTAKRLPGIILSLILAYAIFYGGQMFGIMFVPFVEKYLGGNSVLIVLSRSFLGFGFISLLVFAVVKFIEKRKIATLGFHKENFVMKYLIGFIVGFIMFSLVVLILKLTGNIEVDLNPGVPSGMVALSSILLIIPGRIIQSSTEEILTRGWLMGTLGAKYNATIALIVSSSMFGILHLTNPGVNIISFFNIILIGLFLGLYAIKTNNLWGVCGIHTAWNWAQGNIYGFPISGSERSIAGSLISLNGSGPDWITGGSFGPEAGIAATIIAILGIIICFISLRKSDKN